MRFGLHEREGAEDPSIFLDEEEADLKKMLEVKQLSMFEWASAPVPIRKKDGDVKWCLDYRRFDIVTRKDIFTCR